MLKADAESKDFFQNLVPVDPRVTVKPMFGNLAAFFEGKMFMGLFGRQVFVRLGEADRSALLQEEGTEAFEPMAGRPMREYVVFPDAWREEPPRMTPWFARSMAFTETVPDKPAPKKKRASKE
jgi:TfoX/Sxy family transcriptional regulator of competence genes